MRGIRIRSIWGKQGLDLKEVLRALGPRAVDSKWKCRVDELLSAEPAEFCDRALEDEYDQHGELSGARLLELAEKTRELFDGMFAGYLADDHHPWVVLNCFDSSCREVFSDDPEVYKRVLYSVRNVDEIGFSEHLSKGIELAELVVLPKTQSNQE